MGFQRCGNPTVYMSPTGSDALGNGTLASPYLTLSKSFAALPTGGTIYCRGGTYYQGAENNIGGKTNVTIQAYPGETPIFDGGMQTTFRTVGNNDWTLFDATHNVWVSQAIALQDPGALEMRIKINGEWWLLGAYKTYASLAADAEIYTIDTDPQYAGPGFYHDTVLNLIYVRLTPLASASVFGREADIVWPGNVDPRQNEMVALRNASPCLVTRTGASSNLSIIGLTIQHWQSGINFPAAGTNILIKNCTFLTRFGIQADSTSGQSHDWVVDGVTYRGGVPLWFSWWEIHVGGSRVARVEAKFLFTAHQACYNWEIKNCHADTTFDGMLLGGGAHDFNVHNNYISAMDDGLQMDTSCYNINWHHNYFYGSCISHNGVLTPPAIPGSVWVHHNIVDTRYDFMFMKPDPNNLSDNYALSWVNSIPFSSHSSLESNPWKIYYNTVVWGPIPQTTNPGIGPEFPPTVPGERHEAYNNIFLSFHDGAYQFNRMLHNVRVDTGGEIYDGNCYWRVSAGPGDDPLWTGVKRGVTSTTFASLALFKASVYFTDTKVYYPDGWETHGEQTSPGTVLLTVAKNSPTTGYTAAAAIRDAGVDLSSKTWPDVSPVTIYRGAISPSTDGTEIGP